MSKMDALLGKRIPKYELLKNMFLYAFFGGLAAVIDYGISAFLFAFSIVANDFLASIIGNICGFLFTFTTNTYLNFKKTDKIFARFVSYGIICLLGMGISSCILYLMNGVTVFYISKLIALFVVSAIQFVLNKLITYRN